MTFDQMRADFITLRRGSMALPMTGVAVYASAALLSLVMPAQWHNLTLFLCFWAIMPVGALMMRLRGEGKANPDNPLFRLSALGRVMALATWAIHIPVWIYAPALFALTVGIGFALHWVIFSWTLGHPVGFIHLAMRIGLVLIAWHLVPGNRMGAVSAGIAIAYAVSLVQLGRIDWQARLGLDYDPLSARPAPGG